MTRTSVTFAPTTIGLKPRAAALREVLSKTWLGLGDGVRAWRSYQRLNAMSETELARRGITREEVLRAAMFGAPDGRL
jgi:hypothetical protein